MKKKGFDKVTVPLLKQWLVVWLVVVAVIAALILIFPSLVGL